MRLAHAQAVVTMPTLRRSAAEIEASTVHELVEVFSMQNLTTTCTLAVRVSLTRPNLKKKAHDHTKLTCTHTYLHTVASLHTAIHRYRYV